MFERFYTPASPVAYVVRDAFTHQILITSTHEKCVAYVNAFQCCYVAPA